MNSDNYILAYYQAIKDGSVIVGRWIKLIYEYLIKGLEEGLFYFDLKKANRAINFIEAFVHHSEGRRDLLKLELWQKALISALFGIVDADGVRQFKECFILVARKNGKTLLASAIIAYCTFCDGEYGARTFCLAPKLDQTDLVYSAFRNTYEAEPELNALMKPRKNDLFIPSTNSSVKRIAFNEKKSDGFNPHLVIADEIASWNGDRGLKQYEVMRSALGARRQPVILAITTSGYVNDGIYDELMKRSTAFLQGNTKENRLLPFLYMIDDPNKWNDINELQKSNPNLSVSVPVNYLLDEIVVAESSLSKKAEFLTKYCNIKQNSSQAWIDAVTIDNAFGEELKLEDFAHCYCVVGIDLSQTTDLTAVTVVIEKKEKLYVFAKFFMPRERIDSAIADEGIPYKQYVQKGWLQLSGDNYVDYRDVYTYVVELVKKYKIYPLKIGYDRYSAQYLVADLDSAGFHTDDVYQGNNLTPVIRETEGLIKDGRFNFGNNDLLKMHLLNSAIKTDVELNKLRLVKIAPSDHIDGTAALLDAICVRQKWYSDIGEQLKNKKR